MVGHVDTTAREAFAMVERDDEVRPVASDRGREVTAQSNPYSMTPSA